MKSLILATECMLVQYILLLKLAFTFSERGIECENKNIKEKPQTSKTKFAFACAFDQCEYAL